MVTTQKVIAAIKQLQKMDRPYIIGIDGLSGAGKTTLVEKLQDNLIDEGFKLEVIHIDDLIEVRAKRYNTGHPEWYEYYILQWDVHQIRENIFKAIHKRSKDIHLKFYEPESDQSYRKSIHLEQCNMVIVEGIFLQRKEWSAFFDYMIYLDCPKNVRYDRVLQRDAYIGDLNERVSKYERRYWMAEDYYLIEENPLENSDMVLKDS